MAEAASQEDWPCPRGARCPWVQPCSTRTLTRRRPGCDDALMDSGTIVGTVSSADDGVPIVGAEVIVTSRASNDQWTRQTNADGNYRVSDLDEGLYGVSISALGFTSFSRNDVPVSDGKVVEVNAGLKLTEAG